MGTRKDEIKQKAQATRDAQKKKEKRSRLAFQGGIAGVILAAVVVVVLVVLGSSSAQAGTPGNMFSGGVQFKNSSLTPVSSPASDKFAIKTPPLPKDKVDVSIYIDYQCPFCNDFEKAYGDNLQSLAASGKIDLAYHPIAILDRSSSGTKYSTRAAGASACVAESAPSQWLAFNKLMFANQPAEGGTGLENDRIISITKEAKVDNADTISKCITDKKYDGWATKVTAAASKNLPHTNAGLAATPSIVVDGKLYAQADGDFSAYLNKLIAAKS